MWIFLSCRCIESLHPSYNMMDDGLGTVTKRKCGHPGRRVLSVLFFAQGTFITQCSEGLKSVVARYCGTSLLTVRVQKLVYQFSPIPFGAVDKKEALLRIIWTMKIGRQVNNAHHRIKGHPTLHSSDFFFVQMERSLGYLKCTFLLLGRGKNEHQDFNFAIDLFMYSSSMHTSCTKKIANHRQHTTIGPYKFHTSAF